MAKTGKKKDMRKLFGTDGVRGLANEFPMTCEMAMAIGRASAHVLTSELAKQNKRGKARIVIGKDTRLSGYMIEMALASGICSMGADVILIGPLPTPGVAFVTQSMRADAGIMISASHNAYHDNGIKIFTNDGFKLPDSMEAEIEKLVFSKELDRFRPVKDRVGKAFRIDDVHGRYIVYLKSMFPQNMDLSGMRMVLDCANGAGYKVAPLIFSELGAEVISTGVKPTGLSINDKCGALYPENVAQATTEYRADIGISLDGDGDRCILADENGEIVDGDQIIGICALYLQQKGMLKNDTVVTTPMSNIGMEQSLAQHGIKMIRAKVGDRYVIDEMRKGGYSLGGEQSGHVIFLDHSRSGDGTLAALKVLEVMRATGKKLSELKQDITLYPQVMENVRVKKKEPFENYEKISDAIAHAKKVLGKKGRVFVRYSGTEPLARVMVEGEDARAIQSLSRNIAEQIQKTLG